MCVGPGAICVPDRGVVDIQLVAIDGSRLVTIGVAGQLWDDPASQYR